MTTILNLIQDLSRLRDIDKEKKLTLDGQYIQSISIKEIKHEQVFQVKDNDGNQVYKIDEDDNEVLDDNGNKIPLTETKSSSSYKLVFSVGKENSEYNTANNLIEVLKTLSTVEKEGVVSYGEDDIFIVGKDYTYADRVNIDTDSSL